MAATEGDSDDRIGTIIDRRYRITGLLGRGGSSTVYRAEHVTIRRPVALKLLDRELTAVSEMAQRFEREAFAAGRIAHPNCVTALDFGTLDDGTLFLVLEIVDGLPLADLLEREGRLPVARALRIARHVLRGLASAHEAGVVHRDVKPENVILVDRDGDRDFARLFDFGIAMLTGEAFKAEGGGKLTQVGITFGTPVYMSPEQAMGGTIDARTDLYAVSVTLFEMLTGQPPFDGEGAAVLLAHATTPPPTLGSIMPALAGDARLEELVARGLGKRRHERYDSAAEFAAAIDAYLAPAPAEVGPAPAPRPAARLRDQVWFRPAAYGVTAILLLLIGIAIGEAGHADPFDRFAARLRGGASCEERRRAVVALRELGDDRAIPILEQATRDAARDNACLVDEARRALAELGER